MAGIGFKLRRFTEQEGFSGLVRGYGSAAVVVAGPWLLTVLSLGLAQLAAWVAGVDGRAFGAVLAYCFAGSLILTGPLLNLVTRYLSDRLHNHDESYHLPCFFSSGLLLAPLALLCGLGLFWNISAAVEQRVCAVLTFQVVSQLWLTMVFVGAVRAYSWIVGAFAAGAVTTLATSCLWPDQFAWNFWLGETVAWGLLIRLLTREFVWARSPFDWNFLRYALRYPALPLAGGCFYVAVWIGVVLQWCGPQAIRIDGLWVDPPHDTATFLAMLTTLPALTLFFVRTETEFFDSYRAFFGGILHDDARLGDLAFHKVGMRTALERGTASLFLVQGLISCWSAWQLPSLLHLPPELSVTFRWCVLGSWAMVMVQFQSMILYYYERYRQAAALCGWFAVCHGALAWLSVGSDPWRGSGLLLGALCALPLGFRWIIQELDRLEFHTFMSQPMPGTLDRVVRGEEYARVVRDDGEWLVEAYQ